MRPYAPGGIGLGRYSPPRSEKGVLGHSEIGRSGAGIVTNGGVASTLRDAHVRGYHSIVLSDGCAAFSSEAHDATIISLATIGEVSTCEDIIAALGNTG